MFLTTNQTIADNAYFAQNAVFPGINGSLTAPSTPWIVYGGSLAGLQTALTIKVYGDVLYGGIAASAPISVPVGYPEWYNPIQKYAPQDCVGMYRLMRCPTCYLFSNGKLTPVCV